MGVLFGTDGIRGVAGEHPLDGDSVYKVGYCLTRYLETLDPCPRILIARDTRRSGPWIEAILVRAIHDAGGRPECCGVLSTPAVSFLALARRAHAGIMISASHNPYQDNGIKVFSSEGMKFNDGIEEELEQAVLSSSMRCPLRLSEEEACARNDGFASGDEYRSLYTGNLLRCLPAGFSLEGVMLAVDCAHGALSFIAPNFFRGLGAKVHAIHCEPDGRNINHQAGALHLDTLRSTVLQRKAHLGIAFDGDADRAMFVDAHGQVRDGDDILYILARYGDLEPGPRTVVGTVMANLGLEVALEEIGLKMIRTSVGDRYVLEEMLRSGSVLGGEQSGHLIQLRSARTGDGLLTALRVLEVLQREGKPLDCLCRPVRRFPQILLNVPVREKVPLERIPGLAETEAGCRRLLGARSRIILRYSGTEKLARVMVEGEEETSVQEAAERLAACFAALRP